MTINEIDTYFRDLENIISKISKEDISQTMNLLNEARLNKKKIFVIGNGGSASTATHFACDLNKYTSAENNIRFRAISLVDNIPLVSALVNDEGWNEVYSYQLENLMDDGDYLVVISVHGGSGQDKAGLWSQNILSASKLVQKRGGKVIALVGFDGGAMRTIADSCITVPIDSTPQVEGFHLVLTHLICSIIKDNITNETK